VTDQPPQKVEKPDPPKTGEKRDGYPKLAGDKPGPSAAPPDKPATENKAPARLDARTGGGEKSGGEKSGGEKSRGEKSRGDRPGYPTMARAESSAAPAGEKAQREPARPVEGSPKAPEKPAPGAGGERSGYPRLADQQPAKESASATPNRASQPERTNQQQPGPKQPEARLPEPRQPESKQPEPRQAESKPKQPEAKPAEAKQPEAKPPAEPKRPPAEAQPGKGDKPPPGPPPPENPPEGSEPYISRPRPAAPTEAPRTGDGNVDYNAWGERLKAKGVGGEVDGRVARANNGDKDVAAELRTAERYRDAGYQTSLAPTKENAGVRNPDLDAQYHGASPPENQPLKVEVKSRTDGPMTPNRLNGQISEANAQIKNSNPERTGRGDIIYDASGVRSNMSQADVERFVGGKMRGHPSEDNARLSQVDYLEVMYQNPDNGALQRTYSVRTPDGHVAGPFTEVFR
jgi:hypothetical protein